MGGRLTPADGVAGGEQFVAGSERTHDERVQVETLAEHPHEVAGDEILRDDMQHATPHLHQATTTLQSRDLDLDLDPD